MVNDDNANIFPLYDKIKSEYEKMIEDYSYKRYILNHLECVYIVEDTFVIYIGVVDFGKTADPNYFVVFEELLDNSIFKFNFSGFSRKFAPTERFYMRYKKFHGKWAEPIRDIEEMQYGLNAGIFSSQDLVGYQIESKSEFVNASLPKIKLRERFDKWEGYLYHFIIYELQDVFRKGYAIYYTSNPQIHKIAREKANDVEWTALNHYAWIVNNKPELLEANNKATSVDHFDCDYLYQGVNCDDTIIDLLIDRIKKYKAEGWDHKYKKHISNHTLCIAENDLKYFWVSKYVKSSVPTNILSVAKEIFCDVHDGKYSDIPRYEYLIPTNKWKSEQLVYELAKKVFKKKTILYQHRPFFLKYEKGQMSYDVFICGLNVAIEYQGKQHFEPVEIFGGKEHYERQIIRDRIKMELSTANGVALVHINYWEDISPELIKKRVEEGIAKRNNSISTNRTAPL